jgi:hypothetical protein
MDATLKEASNQPEPIIALKDKKVRSKRPNSFLNNLSELLTLVIQIIYEIR